jgi:L-fuculose-phosphate aldolase
VTTEPEIAELRQLVALGCNILGANGHEDYIWGHVSARDPYGRGIWMKASTYGFEETTPDHVILVSFAGELLEGEHPQHVEWPIHTEILRVRDDLAAVVHSHPPHSIAVGASGQPLRPLSHAGTMFVPPGLPRFTKTANLIVTPAMGSDVADELGGQDAMMLVNHGIVTAGPTVQSAVIAAVLLEKASHQQILTYMLGEPTRWSSDEEALAKRETVWAERQLLGLWDYLARSLPSRR